MRRPAGLKTKAQRDLYDELATRFDVRTPGERNTLAQAVRWRTRADDMLAADRQTAAVEAGRRADRLLGELRQRPTQPNDTGTCPRIKHLAATFRREYAADRFTLLDHADADVALYAALLEARGHFNDMTRAERAWADGDTTERPDMPKAA